MISAGPPHLLGRWFSRALARLGVGQAAIELTHALSRPEDEGGPGIEWSFIYDATEDLRYPDWHPMSLGWRDHSGRGRTASHPVGARQPALVHGIGPGGADAVRGDGEDDVLSAGGARAARQIFGKLLSRSQDAAPGQLVWRVGGLHLWTTAAGYAVSGPDGTPGPQVGASKDAWHDVIVTIAANGASATLEVDGLTANAPITYAEASGEVRLLGAAVGERAWAGSMAFLAGSVEALAGQEATAVLDYMASSRFTSYQPPADREGLYERPDPNPYTEMFLLSTAASEASVAQANAIARSLGSAADAETFSLARTWQSSDGDVFATALTQLRADQAGAIEAPGTLEMLIPGADSYDRSTPHVGVARDADGQALGGYVRVATSLGRAGETIERSNAEARAILALDAIADPLAAPSAYGYWRADAITGVADGASFSTWEDLAGVGDATAATNPPFWHEGGGTPYVDCTGGDHLAVPRRIAQPAPDDTEHEIWIVLQPEDVQGFDYVYGPLATGGGLAIVNGDFSVYNPNFNQRLSFVPAFPGVRYLLRLRYLGAGNGNYTLQLDSSAGDTNGAGGQTWQLHTEHMIARRRHGSFESGFDGFLYMIWHPMGRITGDLEAAALQYCQDTWGVRTPARYPS